MKHHQLTGRLQAPSLRNLNRWQWSVTLLQFAADPALTTRSTSWYPLRVSAAVLTPVPRLALR
jgi:alpha-N-arabinofuranosidase